MIKDIIKTSEGYDAIVVEGYDGVGKGKILSDLSKYYNITPYRPDYNLWQQFDLRKEDRWKISGFFWDIYSHFRQNTLHRAVPMLFDRGVISGAVYANDITIAEHYKEIIRDRKVMHVLVTCTARDYYRFSKARNPLVTDGYITDEWVKCQEYTDRYIKAMKLAGIDYIIYCNEYDDNVPKGVCSSCGHYSYGVCRHPSMNCEVDANNALCPLSTEREVQDIDSEMYSLQS